MIVNSRSVQHRPCRRARSMGTEAHGTYHACGMRMHSAHMFYLLHLPLACAHGLRQQPGFMHHMMRQPHDRAVLGFKPRCTYTAARYPIVPHMYCFVWHSHMVNSSIQLSSALAV